VLTVKVSPDAGIAWTAGIAAIIRNKASCAAIRLYRFTLASLGTLNSNVSGPGPFQAMLTMQERVILFGTIPSHGRLSLWNVYEAETLS
jgi:hypothetical protein